MSTTSNVTFRLFSNVASSSVLLKIHNSLGEICSIFKFHTCRNYLPFPIFPNFLDFYYPHELLANFIFFWQNQNHPSVLLMGNHKNPRIGLRLEKTTNIINSSVVKLMHKLYINRIPANCRTPT